MFWTYCVLKISGPQGPLTAFVNDHGLPGEDLSFQVIARVPLFEDPEGITGAWGSSGPPEPTGTPFSWGYPQGIRLAFRCPAAPPTSWFRRATKKYPGIHFVLVHATEPTGIHGALEFHEGVLRTTETEGDPQGVQDIVSEAMAPLCSRS